MIRVLALLLPLLLGAASEGDAQRRCTKGIPCGNTCIAANKTCRVGSGTATTTAVPLRSSQPAAAAVRVPGDAFYVASSRGRVYYATSCNAWRSLAPANLVWFKTYEEAQDAGYTPSTSAGCGPTLRLERTPTPLLRQSEAVGRWIGDPLTKVAFPLACPAGVAAEQRSKQAGQAVVYFNTRAAVDSARFTPVTASCSS